MFKAIFANGILMMLADCATSSHEGVERDAHRRAVLSN